MTVSVQEVARYLRMGGNAPDGALAARIEELIGEATRVLRPARVWRRLPVARVPMPGTTLLRHLEGCDDAYLVCGTLGSAFDALHRRVSVTSGADALIVQAVGATLIERHMDGVEDEIRAELAPGEALVTRYSPGYGDFPLEAQREILALLDTPRRIGVSLTDSLLMVPSKSVSAVIGVTRDVRRETRVTRKTRSG